MLQLAQGALAPTENARALGSPLTSDCKLLASSGRLIVNAIVLYNTIYTQRALDHLAAAGLRVDDVHIERLSPLGSDHLTLSRTYLRSPTRPQRVPRAQRRARRRGLTRFGHELSIDPCPETQTGASVGRPSRFSSDRIPCETSVRGTQPRDARSGQPRKRHLAGPAASGAYAPHRRGRTPDPREFEHQRCRNEACCFDSAVGDVRLREEGPDRRRADSL